MDQLTHVLSDQGTTYEIIAVDDGSNDGTHEILQDLASDFSHVLQVVTHPYNKGMGAAIKTGIRAALGEIIATMDSDGQHDPRDLPRLLPYMKDYDLVVGARSQAYEGTWYRNVANRFYNGLASWLAEFPIEDLTSGYRLYRATVVRRYAELFPTRFSLSTTSTLVFLRGGYNVRFVPISARPRQGGASKIRVTNDGWRFLLIILKVIVLFEPLRVFLPVALLSFGLAILFVMWDSLLVQHLRVSNSTVVLVVLSTIVLLLGLVSEQIAMMQISLRETSRRNQGE